MKWHRSQLKAGPDTMKTRPEYQYLMLDLPDWQWR
jgi:hypothetical protein